MSDQFGPELVPIIAALGMLIGVTLAEFGLSNRLVAGISSGIILMAAIHSIRRGGDSA